MAQERKTGGYKKPYWYKQTENLLRRKKEIPVEIDNLKLQLQLDRLSGPRIISQYKVMEGTAAYSTSPTENAVLKYESKEEQIEQRQILLDILENTIRTFSPEEYQIYFLRYESELKDYEVYEKIGVCRSSYFELQKRLVVKAARLIGLTVPQDEKLPGQDSGALLVLD
jgi:DNA-directed RNA polymerase specialized sigma subunit